MKNYITKTDYCNGHDCTKKLWLMKNRRELFVESPDSETNRKNGKTVGDLAKGLFGPYKEIELSPDPEKMAAETQELLKEGTPVICEAAFIFEDLFCRTDILKRLDDGSVEIYEVKAENDLKDINYDDVAFQTYVIRNAGAMVSKVCLVHLDRDYERLGELELDKLFKIADVTELVNDKLVTVPVCLSGIRSGLASDEASFPEIAPKCAKKKCGFWKYCSAELPQPNVFSLNGTRVKMVTQYKLYSAGIISYEDIATQADLKKEQLRQVDVYLSGEPYIDIKGIKETLDCLSYPLYFLDFETYSEPIPPYDNIHPYMQVPFQYSLHYIEEEGGELKHKEFLAPAGTDSRRAIAEQLCEDIPSDVCVTAYSKSFECLRLKELAALYPDLSDHLLAISGNIVDLETPFKKQYYVLPAMKGLSTIKLVLPALFPDDPELDYTKLDKVHKGNEASAAFLAMADMSEDEQMEMRQHLLKYCGLDTLAMVRIWERLREIAC